MRISYLIAPALLLAAMAPAGCSQGDSQAERYGLDTAQVTTLTDSLSYQWGRHVGLTVAKAYQQLDSSYTASMPLDKVFEGAANVLSGNLQSDEYVAGANIGLQMANQLDLLETSGIEISRTLAGEEFHRAFTAEHPDSTEIKAVEAAYDSMMSRAQKRILGRLKQQRIIEQKALDKIREENIVRTQEYLTRLLASDSAIVVVDSTLCYRVDSLGTGKTPGEYDNIRFRYILTDIDGTVIDSNTDQYIEGPIADIRAGALRKGISMMPAGSRYTFYITNAGRRSALPNVQPGRLIKAQVELIATSPDKK